MEGHAEANEGKFPRQLTAELQLQLAQASPQHCEAKPPIFPPVLILHAP